MLAGEIGMATLYSNKQRYNFESNSQLSKQIEAVKLSCIPISKDTILKAIHNKDEVSCFDFTAVFQ